MDEQELLPISQDNEDLDIDLFAGADFLNTPDVRDQPGFQYPAMLISGIRFKDTLRVLQSVRRESWRLMDVWVDLEDSNPPVKQGTLQADLKSFLTMRYLGLNVTLYASEDNITTLNLQDPSVLMNLI